MAAMINGMAKRKKQQDDSLSHNKRKARRMVWSDDLHAKFVDAVNVLGIAEAVPRKIIALMNVEGITTSHVASHLQKYRLRMKKAVDKVPSTLIQPAQSQYINIHPSYKFPANQTSPLFLPNKLAVHQSHSQIYSPTGFNMSGPSPSTLIQSQNINNSSSILHPPPSISFPIYHQTSTFPTLVNQYTTPLDFHDSRATNFPLQISNHPFLFQMNSHDVAASSKCTSIWDYDWYQKYMKREPQLLQFPHNSLPVWETYKTSQNSQMKNSQQVHNVEPIIVGSSASLEDTNINISDYNRCDDDSLIDFSVEETDPNYFSGYYKDAGMHRRRGSH
ncbi:putative Myb family transcription factor At1g14600 [Vicia villosa]|uniref:putative Myb family transcription factor At1g14600 n=1 Tax=Vicia villosa TaxID=3911 RepID=UPI00273B1AB5|nr:putative Myb family transcription factor At1g14600 [Vicia villosa]